MGASGGKYMAAFAGVVRVLPLTVYYSEWVVAIVLASCARVARKLTQ